MTKIREEMNFVKELLDLDKLFRGKRARVDTFDFSAEVCELGSVYRRRKRKRSNLNGHCGSQYSSRVVVINTKQWIEKTSSQECGGPMLG